MTTAIILFLLATVALAIFRRPKSEQEYLILSRSVPALGVAAATFTLIGGATQTKVQAECSSERPAVFMFAKTPLRMKGFVLSNSFIKANSFGFQRFAPLVL